MSDAPDDLGLAPVTVTNSAGAVTQTGWALWERSGDIVRMSGRVMWSEPETQKGAP